MSNRLFVIEAPLKARGLEALLERIGFPAKVQATKGHLFQLPEDMKIIGIDRSFRDFERKPRDLAIVERLRREAEVVDEVFIATDADSEGEVIGWDVFEVIRDLHPAPRRVRLKGMDDDSVKQSIAEAAEMRKIDAVGGRTRAIVDRLIGVGFSNKGVAVGRIGTALLGLVQSQNPQTALLRLVAPAKDGGRPWSAECDLADPVTAALADKLVELRFPALEFAAAREIRTPSANMGDVMVRAGDQLDLSPKETATSMQNLYEGGRASYPRAGSRGMSPTVVRKMAEVLRAAGYKVDDNAFPIKPETDAHDAPYPIGRIDVKSDPRKLAQDDAVRAVMTRGIVKCGQRQSEQTPVVIVLIAFLQNRGFSHAVADWVSRMPWRREVGPRYPGQESWPESALTQRRADVVLLEKAMAAGLGRPSTWANHIEKFMTRGLVDENLKLTAKGHHWIANSPRDLLNPRLSAAIENVCERVTDAMMSDPDREPWEINAERIVRALPPEMRQVIDALIMHEEPHAKTDPIRDYGLDTSAVAEAENSAANAPAYAMRESDDF